MFNFKSVMARLSVLFLLIGPGLLETARAQSTLARTSPLGGPSLSATEAETEELRLHIRELQERLEKLESIQRQDEVAASYLKARLSVTPSPSSSTTQDVTTQENPAKPTQTETHKDDDKDKGVMNFFRNVEFSGFVDGYYGYNFNKPFNRRNQLQNFNFKNNEFGLNLAEFVVEKKASEDSRFGFRLDLDYGPATDWVHSAEPGGVETYKNVQQAYGSFLAPLGNGLQIDVGKFVTWNGAEVIETKDNWNYTRGLLFAWAIPYYHAGARATYAINDKVTIMGALVNGWNNVEDSNGGKTVGLSLTVKPTSKLSIIQNYTGGPEESDAIPVPAPAANRSFFRHLYDTTVSYAFNEKVAAMVNYDYGIERQRATGSKVHWQGVAAYLHYMPTEKWAFGPRFEWFDDNRGFATCSEDPAARCTQRKIFKEITLTSEYKFAKYVLGRLEFRNDWATSPFFRKSTRLPAISPESVLSKNQSLITAGLVFSFSTREQ
jgi:hypothetical protein